MRGSQKFENEIENCIATVYHKLRDESAVVLI